MKGGAAGLAEANRIGEELRRVQAEIEGLKGGSPAASKDEIAPQRSFVYAWGNEGSRPMELLPDGTIGKGASGHRPAGR